MKSKKINMKKIWKNIAAFIYKKRCNICDNSKQVSLSELKNAIIQQSDVSSQANL